MLFSPPAAPGDAAGPAASALRFEPISVLTRTLRSGQVAAADLVAACLDRIAAHDAKLGAFVEVYADEALQVARSLDGMAMAGVRLGPLHGVPFVAKDLFDVEGRVTRAGSRALPDTPAARSAVVVDRLRRAGMVLLGKTNTVEFAFGGWGTNPVVGTPWNPWDLKTHRIPGGSSSGTAVAVAAGMAPWGLGTDTGGSVRIPAGLCGLVGVKTSPGLVPRTGVFALSRTHDTVGPLARTVLDAALILEALQGPDAADPATEGAPILAMTEGIGRGIRGMTLAFLPAESIGDLAPAVAAVYGRALAALEALGARLVEIALPSALHDYTAWAGDIMGAESYASLHALVDDGTTPIAPEIRQRIRRGRGIGAADYLDLLDRRRAAKRAFLETLDHAAALIAPTCPIVATPVSEVDESRTPLSELGRFVNLLDLCAVALPAGLADGLPASVQVIGRSYAEPTALRIADALEREVGRLVPAAF